MEGFKSYSGYKVGASHIAHNMNCEDFAASYDDEKVSAAVISDGHGDKKCFRSAQGARTACEVSIDCVKRLINSSPLACDVLKESPDRIITELEREIIREWHKGIADDLNNNPITDSELKELPEDAAESIRAGHGLDKIYGCTLIMCVVIEDFWFGIQIGDGKCVAAMRNGLYTQPIPWDEKGCVGNRSTSICNSNSYAGFRYVYGTDVPAGLFVASDGVDESFDESGLNRCYYTLGYWIQTMQKEELDAKMEELLSQITSNGSGDDVSIASILSLTNGIKRPYASSEQVGDKLKELIDNIKAKETQFDSLTESKREASESLEELQYEIEDLKKKIILREEQIKDKEQEIISIDNNVRSVIIQLKKMVIQLPKAKDTKVRIDQYWTENGVDIKEDAELEYLPRYSEEFLENIIIEIEGLQEETQRDHESEDTRTIDRADESIQGDVHSDTGEEQNVDRKIVTAPTEKTVDIQIEADRGSHLVDNSQEIDVMEKPSEEMDMNSQKNGFFGGIFGRKK